jgi:hypothetical protein
MTRETDCFLPRSLRIEGLDCAARLVRIAQVLTANNPQHRMLLLGPGADASHKTHVHVDLKERHHGTRICQWNITD